MKKTYVFLICSALFTIIIFSASQSNFVINALDVDDISTLNITNISEPKQVKHDEEGYYIDNVCDFGCGNSSLETQEKTYLPSKTPKGNEWIIADQPNDIHHIVISFAIDLSQFNPNSDLKYFITNQELQNEYHPLVITNDHMIISVVGVYQPNTQSYDFESDNGILTLAIIGDAIQFVGIDDSNFSRVSNEAFNVKFAFDAYVPENDPTIGNLNSSSPNTEYYLNIKVGLNGEVTFNAPIEETPISNNIGRIVPLLVTLLIVVATATGGYLIYRRKQNAS